MTATGTSDRPNRRRSGAHHRLTTVDLHHDVMAAVRVEPGLNATEVAHRFPKQASSTIRDHLEKAAAKGLLERRGKRYFPAPSEATDDAVIDRIGLLLYHLKLAPLGLSAGALATATGVPETTVAEDLRAAARCGWVHFDASQKCHIDWQVIPTPSLTFDAEALQSVLQNLADFTGSSAFLASLDRSATMCMVSRSEARGVLYEDDIVDGLGISAHSSALGRALMATFSPRERAQYFRERGLTRLTGQTVRTLEDLNRILAGAANDGRVYIEHGETIPDIHCTAVLVRNGVPYGERFALAVAHRGKPTDEYQRKATSALRECVADLAPLLMSRHTPPSEIE